MSEGVAFDRLVQALHHTLAALPDARQGKNTRYTIKEGIVKLTHLRC